MASSRPNSGASAWAVSRYAASILRALCDADAREDGRGERPLCHALPRLACGKQFNCFKSEGEVGVGQERVPCRPQAFRYLAEDGPGDSRAERPAHQIKQSGRAAAIARLIAERPGLHDDQPQVLDAGNVTGGGEEIPFHI